MDIKALEQTIIQGCRAGKAKYQEMLYELYYGKMMSVCLRYARDREEARDILQEGYIKVFNGIANFKGDGSLEGWIRRIMVNTAINHYHKNKKYNLHSSIEEDFNDPPENALYDDKVIQEMNYEDLLKLIRTLPPAYQTVFNLYVLEGYNHKEIGELLNINEGTSKSNLAKARMKLQKQLNQWLDNKSYSPYVEEG
ncbi:MAG: sigma-70 family RNA polymerase sigma factor [Microscillaceae bacterium]|jgi:RNA polymerase sigma-70 factor (ECF subfamily)|nr:sigma-70 family RNA polymerase sigma factor [Microscillaceae bacterium]